MVRQTASRMPKIVLQSSRSEEQLIDVEYLLLSAYEKSVQKPERAFTCHYLVL
jgi:hypothetical protein